MRYLYAYFKNYIGFYNGMQIRELEIDFTKCKNNIVLICGINGSGKSTLLDALSPFVDPTSSYIPGYDAEKELKLVHESDIYDLHIISSVDSKGSRKQTKAFISKNGIQLNENGNVTTYKDIIFSEFDMDSNYMSLTKLSSTNRGLGDKTPAERKKFAASIVDNLETYNDMYKTLNKKSLIFKSHINTLHTKIQNIGSKDELQIKLNSLKQQSDSISAEIMGLNNKIVELETRSSINQEDASKLEELKKHKELIQIKLSTLDNQIDLLINKTHIKRENIVKEYDNDFELSQVYSNKANSLSGEWKAICGKMTLLSNSIHELEVDNETYSGSIDYELEEKYRLRKKMLLDIKYQLNSLNIDTDSSNIDKLYSLLEFYKTLIRKIDSLYDGLDFSMLTYIALNYDNLKTARLKAELESSTSLESEKSMQLLYLNEIAKSLGVLLKRPNNCKIDSCPFISESKSISVKYGSYKDVENKIDILRDEISELQEKITGLKMYIEVSSLCDSKRMILEEITSDISNMSSVIKLFGDTDLLNTKLFYKNISNSYQFNNQRQPQRLIDGLNLLKMLQAEYRTVDVLRVQYEAMKDKISIVEKNESLIQKNKEELEKCQLESEEIKSSMDNYSSLLASLTKKLGIEREYIDKLNTYDKIVREELSVVEDKIKEIEKKSLDSISSINQIVGIKNRIEELSVQSQPIITEIQKLSGQLTMLDSYYQEHEIYSVKYNMIETLKKYCSPTGGGIQTLFMQLYMSKTLDIANQILMMLFNGEYKLLDFVINQNEFRIPFIGSGLPVDDISSGSCSQIAMMGLAINMALFYQASTRYNIPRFDEIESGLDSYNREKIINIFYYIIKMLNIEQAFIISHSLELDNSLLDIIKLRMHQNSDQVFLGNVIYDDSNII